MYRILNSVIEEHAGNDLILDFEGSMIESVAVFIKGFGGTAEVYYRMNKSKIPFIK